MFVYKSDSFFLLGRCETNFFSVFSCHLFCVDWGWCYNNLHLLTMFFFLTFRQMNFTAMEVKIGELRFKKTEKIDSNGIFGKAFKGTLEERTDVAVKRVALEDFDVDLEAIRRVNNHQHVLRFYCNEQDMDYMQVFHF